MCMYVCMYKGITQCECVCVHVCVCVCVRLCVRVYYTQKKKNQTEVPPLALLSNKNTQNCANTHKIV